MSEILKGKPRDDGYFMPAEFHHHDMTWMLWPSRADIWRNGGAFAKLVFSQVAAQISQFEPVTVGADQKHYQEARSTLPRNIRVVEMSYDDVWIRDTGPTFLINDSGDTRAVNWNFNAWGGLFASWDLDEQVAEKVLEIEKVDKYRPGIVLEGGAIHVDGEGTLLTTAECLLNPNRNEKLNKASIEQILGDYLGINKIVWFNNGVFLDETGGHIDNLCCFIRPGEIALTWTNDQNDPQYDISREAYEILMHEKDASGRRFTVHKVHQPGPLYFTEDESLGIETVSGTIARHPGDRLTASYINFYIVNKGVIVPTFDDPFDGEALQTIQSVFPERKIVGIPSREILLGGGNIHCVVQQQPSRKLS